MVGCQKGVGPRREKESDWFGDFWPGDPALSLAVGMFFLSDWEKKKDLWFSIKNWWYEKEEEVGV